MQKFKGVYVCLHVRVCQCTHYLTMSNEFNCLKLIEKFIETPGMQTKQKKKLVSYEIIDVNDWMCQICCLSYLHLPIETDKVE